MPAKTPLALVVAAGASLVNAHGYVSSWTIGGTTYAGFDEQWAAAAGTDTGNEFIAWSTTASDNGFVAPDAFASGDIICHRGATNAALNNATVAAGGTVTATWNTWPDSHHGPVITYIAAADDPTTVDKTTLEWIKIDEAGLISGSNPGTWASDNLISNGFAYDVTIPSALKAGNYVMRHEIIALHAAENADGAQNYPQCVNLQVTGDGTELPAGTLGTALYTEDEDGIVFNIYSDFTSYPIPGPALAFGDGSSSSAAAAATTAAAAAPTTTAAAASSAAPTTEAAAPTTAASSAAAVATGSSSSSSSSCKKRRHARDLKN